MNRTRIIATTLVAGLIAAGATLDFVGNGGSGYWRARLTLVGGN